MNQGEENKLLEEFRRGNEKAFETVFRTYYGPLCVFAGSILQNEGAAEEVVQDFFVKLWEDRSRLLVQTSLKSYLFQSVKNQALNVIKHEKIKLRHAQHVVDQAEKSDFSDLFVEPGLLEAIERGIDELPEKRREIFRLSREEGLKYREIAEKLNLSIKTVEAQMGLAIKYLREKLKHYNSFLFLLIFQKNKIF